LGESVVGGEKEKALWVKENTVEMGSEESEGMDGLPNSSSDEVGGLHGHGNREVSGSD